MSWMKQFSLTRFSRRKLFISHFSQFADADRTVWGGGTSFDFINIIIHLSFVDGILDSDMANIFLFGEYCMVSPAVFLPITPLSLSLVPSIPARWSGNIWEINS